MSERLKEIENLLDRYYSTEDGFEQTDLAIEIIQGYVDWLIEQAERVQELEDIIYKDERQAVLESMYEENKRYREALEFYADKKNYLEMIDPSGVLTVIEEDNGEIARQALAGGNE